jgi:hypothetical protein
VQGFTDIIPVKSYIQYAVVNRLAWKKAFQFSNKSLGNKHSPWLDTDDHGILNGRMRFQNLVSKPLDRY